MRKTSDHQNIFKKKSRKKSKRRSKGGLKPSNRKHLGSDNEIQNFPKQTFDNPQKTETFGRSKTIRKPKTKKKCETRNFISSFLGKRRKFNLGMTISGP